MLARRMTICPAHPGVEADGTCSRCGVFVCVTCAPMDQVPRRCRACDLVLQTPPSTRATVSLWLAVGGFPLVCVPYAAFLVVGTALSAAVLGALEVKAISLGQAPTTGLRRAQLGRGLGFLQLGLLALLALALYFFREWFMAQPTTTPL